MKEMLKKALSLFLVVVMMVSFMPLEAFAAGGYTGGGMNIGGDDDDEPINADYTWTMPASGTNGTNTIKSSTKYDHYSWAVASGNNSVLTVQSGSTSRTVTLTLNGPGVATVTDTRYDNKITGGKKNQGTDTYTILVLPYISASNITKNFYVGDVQDLSITTNPADCELLFSGGNSSIVSRDGKTLTALSAGTTNINVRAKSNGIYNPQTGWLSPTVVVSEALVANDVNVFMGGSAKLAAGSGYTVPSPNLNKSSAVFTVDDPSVATIAADGTITPVSVGSTAYTVTLTHNTNGNTVTRTAYIHVNPTVSLSDKTIYEGQTVSGWALANPEASTVSYASANTAVASVSGSGLKGESVGTAAITATAEYNGRSATAQAELTVRSNVKSVSVSADGSATDAIRIAFGMPFVVDASYKTFASDGKKDYDVTWEVVSGGDLVTLTPDGKSCTIKAGAEEGTAVVRAKAGDQYKDITVTVYPAEFHILPAAYPESGIFYVGQNSGTALYLQSKETNTWDGEVWTSSDPSVATVDPSTGKVTAVGTGTAEISAVVLYKSKEIAAENVCVVTVNSNVQEVVFSQTTVEHDVAVESVTECSEEIPEGTTYNFGAVIRRYDDTATTPALVWSTSDDSVVGLTDNGAGSATITALSRGTADVVARSEGKTAVDHITVVSNIDEVDLPSTHTTYKNVETSLFGVGGLGSVIYKSGEGRVITQTEGDGGYEISFRSSDTSVATVSDDGVITGVNAGEAVITVVIDGVSYKINLTVGDSIKDFDVIDEITLDVNAEESDKTYDLLSEVDVTYVDETGKDVYVKYTDSPIQPAIEWTSDNTAVATVDETGKVTAVAQGVCTVTANIDGLRRNITVKVLNNGEEPDIDDTVRYSIVIKYVIATGPHKGEEAARNWSGKFSAGSRVLLDVTSPTAEILGYKPESSTYTETINCLTGNVERTVYYYPEKVGFTVRYYDQVLEGDAYDVESLGLKYKLRETKYIPACTDDPIASYKTDFDNASTTPKHFTKLSYTLTDVNSPDKKGNTVAADGSTVVEIYYNRTNYLVNFELGGGFGVNPVFGPWGQSFSVTNDPTRAGYTFAGWYTQPDGQGEKVNLAQGSILQQNVTYYAAWKESTASYKVIHWLQNADDDGYTYYKMDVKSGTVGTDTDAKKLAYDDNTDFTSAHFDNGQNVVVTNQKIAADGSTVVNIYYPRKTYTIAFYTATSENGCKDSNKIVSYENVRYNQSISGFFSAAPIGTTYAGKSWKATGYSYALQTLDRMPANDVKLYNPNSSSSVQKQIYYYVEKVGNTASLSWASPANSYELLKTVSTYFNYITYQEEYHEIQGFERFTAKEAGFSSNQKSYTNNTVSLYYKRLSYQLDYNNGEKVVNNVQVKYQDLLKNHLDYVPTSRPAGIPASWQFQGWCLDPACKTPVGDTDQMPAGNMVLYAKWAPAKVTLEVRSENIDNATHSLQFRVGAGYSVKNDPELTWDDTAREAWEYVVPGGSVEFIGWFTSDNVPFSFDQIIDQDTVVVALFRNESAADVLIHYVDADTHEAIPNVSDSEDIGFIGEMKSYVAKRIVGYYPVSTTHSMILSESDSANYDKYTPATDTDPALFEYSFLYKKAGGVNYTVKCVNEETSEELTAYGYTDYTTDNVITVSAPAIQGLTPSQRQQTFTLTASADDNVITFYYHKPDGKTASVEVYHWKEDPANPGTFLKPECGFSAVDNAEVGKEFAYTKLTDLEGYEYSHTTWNDGTDLLKVPAEGLKIDVYYVCAQYPYSFRFVDAQSNTLADPVESTARFGTTVSCNAKEIPGYSCAKTSDSMTIAVTASATDPGSNVRTFVYTENTVDIYYEALTGGTTDNPMGDTGIKVKTGSPKGATAIPNTGYDFVGWYADEDCTEFLTDDLYFKPSKNAETGLYESKTYYALFEQTMAQYTVNYIALDDNHALLTPAETGTKVIGETVSGDSTKTFTGYTFARMDDPITVGIDKSKNVVNVYYYKNVTLTANSKTDYVYDGEEKTVTGYTCSVDGLTFTGVSAAGSGTAAGEYAVTFSGVTANETNDGTYIVTELVPGTLKISDSTAEITVTVSNSSFTYDGTAHTAAVTVTGLPKGYVLDTAAASATATHVAEGKVAAACDTLVILDAAGTDVTSKLNIKYVDGSVTVTPATLTVTTGTASKTYDGTALTAEGSIDGFVTGETYTFTVTGSQTAVGTSDNTYTLVFDKTAVATDYAVSEDIGTLTVSENTAKITVTVTGGEFTYDGQAHGATVTVSALPAGYTLAEAASNDTATHVSEGTVTADCDKLVIKNAQGVDVTKSLNIEYVNGSITIKPAALTIVTESADKVYDGTALTADGSVTGFIAGEAYTFTVTGSRTEVGESKNTYTLTFDGTTEETDYTIVSKTIGTLTVTDAAMTLSASSYEGVYDGASHTGTVSCSEKDAVIEYSTDNGTTWTKTAPAVTHVGEPVAVKVRATKANFAQATAEYTLKVTPAELTVVTPDKSKTYDGTALTAAGSVTGFVSGETYTFATTGTQTAVGSSNNTYTLTFNGTALKTDYTVKETVGTLTVSEYAEAITVTTTGGTFTYDGAEHKATVSVSALPTGYTLAEASSNDKATHVSEGTVTANCDKLVILNAAGEDVTSKLTITYNDDTIVINPAPLTIVTESANKVYDGTVLTAPGKVEGFVNNETYTFTVTGKQTKVGSSYNTYTLTFDGTTKETDYTVSSETIGTLTVTESTAEITVTTTGGTFTYDGQAHGATVSVSTLPEGYTLDTASSSATATHVAEGEVKATCDTLKILNAAGEDVTSKLNVTYKDGTIKINPATLTVTTESASKVYDGKALTADGSITGFVTGETATFTVTDSRTEVGESNNTYTLVFDKTAVATDYTVSAQVGTLTVTESTAEITVTVTGGEFTYDGKAHGATVSVTGIPEGYTLDTAASSATATHVAEGEVKATCDTLIIRNAANEDVTSKLNVKITDGTIKINPAPLTVTTESADKVYDGKALTAKGSVTGFIAGETATFTVTGTQTEVGESDNTYTLVFNQSAKEKDYKLTSETIGKLKVTDAAMTLSTTSYSGVYDGASHTGSVSCTESDALLEYSTDGGTTWTTTEPTVTHVGEPVSVKVRATKANFAPATAEYTLEVTPATLTVTTPGASKTYDGTALTKAGTITGFVSGETYTFATTGTQTAVGSSNNTYTLTYGTALESDYTVKETIGTLTVTESTAEITVTVTGGSFPYDGKAHGATVSVSELPEGYTLVTASSSASVTHVADGKVTASCDTLKIVNAQGEDVTKKLKITNTSTAEISITPLPLTVTTPSATQKYNGTALTGAQGASVTGFLSGETATFAVTGSQLNAGSSNNTYTLTFNQTAQADDYEVKTENLGTLTVTKRSVTLTSDTASKTYDGTALISTEISVGGDGFVAGEGFTAVVTGTVTYVSEGTVTNAFTYSLNNGTLAQNYDITKATGTLKILPRGTDKDLPLQLKANDATKNYDGTALTADGYEIRMGALVDGDEFEYVTVSGSITDVGQTASKVTGYKVTRNGVDVTDCYTFADSVDGVLTVTRRPLKFTSATDSKTYDGTALTNDNVVITGTVPSGEGFTFTVTGSQTEVGKSRNTFTYDPADGTNPDNYNIKTEEGLLTVSEKDKVVVTITEHSGEYTYDGTVKTVTGYDVSISDELYTLNDFTFSGTASVSGTAAGTYPMELQPGDFKNTNPNFKDVTFKIVDGTLKINPVTTKIVITAESDSKTYDGTALTNAGFTYTQDVLAQGDVLTAVVEGTITDAGSTSNVVKSYVVKNAAGEDVTANYAFGDSVDGTLTVARRDVTLTSETASKTYDGTALKAETVKVTGDGFADGEGATYSSFASITDVGETANTFEYTLNNGTNAANYNITKADGTLTVSKSESTITITAATDEKFYDGTALPNAGYEYTQGILAQGDVLTAVVAGTVTNAYDGSNGTVSNVVTSYIVKNAAGEDVTANYNIETASGTLTVNPCPVTFTSATDSKTYDGTALTNDKVTVDGDVPAGEGFTFTVTGSQTMQGSSDNLFTYDAADGTDLRNYDVTQVLGKLTVNKVAATITVTAASDEKTYDGTALTNAGYTFTEGILAEGDTLTAVVEGTLTDAGSTANVVKSYKVLRGTQDVTGNYTITTAPGTLTVNPKAVTLTSADADKVYDGTALTKDQVTASENGFVGTDGFTFSCSGSQTAVGNSKNTFTYTLNDGTKASNYTITKVEGTLTVTEYTGEITVTTTGGTFEYDGQAHGATVAVSALPTGYTLEKAESNESATHVSEGTIAANCDTLVIKNAQGVDVTKSLNIKYVDGTIKINPATLTVTTESASKTYDGEALTADGKIEDFKNGETATFTVTGTQTAVGGSKNTYTLTFDGTAAATDYTVSEKVGTLTVDEYAEEITVTTTGGTFTYDGKTHGATVSVSTLPTGYTLEKAESNDSATHVAEGVVEANCDTLVIRNKAGEDVTAELKIKYVDGSIKINPATLTVTTESASKVYDGEALTATGNVEGFVNNETATFTVTGTQTAVGSSDNSYTLTFDKTAAESDYTVSEQVGTLTVSEYAGEVTVITTGGEFTYNGQAHGATVEVTGIPEGYTLETAVSDDTATHVSEGTVTADCDTLKIVNAAGEDVTAKLNIKYVDGSIKINPATLTVTTPNASKTYDGEALTAEGSITGFIGDETATFTTTGTQTAVGSSDNTYTLTFDGTAANDDYTVSAQVGILTVNEYAGEITVTTTGGEFTYDGQAHGATVAVTGLPTGYTVVTATSDDSATHVAEGKVEANCDTLVIKNAQGVDVTKSLNVKYVDGSITITPATLTVTTETASKTYDGTALTADGKIEGFKNGETYTFTVTGTQTTVGSSDNTYTLTFDKTAVATDYIVSEDIGTLTVELNKSVVVTITEASGTVIYNGTEQSVTGYTVKSISDSAYTESDFTFSGTAEAKGTVVGTYPMELKPGDFTNTNKNFEDVTFAIEDGSLTITPIAAKITVTAASANKMYDGKALTDNGFTFTEDVLLSGDELTAVVEGTVTNVGKADNVVKSYKVMRNGTDVTSCYTFLPSVNGTLEVTKRDVKLTSATDKKTYDGKALTNATVTPSGSGFVTGEGFDANVTGSRLDAGTSDNTFTYTLKEGTLAANYTITTEIGTLTVEPIATKIIITANSAEQMYNGKALTDAGFTYTEGVLVDGDVLTATVAGTITDAGTADNVVTAYKVMRGETDVTRNYTFGTPVAGTLTVTKRSVTLTSATDSKTYDGSALKAETVEVTGDGFVDGEGVTYSDFASITDVGSTSNTFEYTLNGNTKAGNYTIETANGTLTIEAITTPIIITAGSADKMYDGQPLTKNTFTYTEGVLVTGDVLTAVVEGTVTDAGTAANEVTSYKVMRGQTDITANYTFGDSVDGELEVTKRTVTLTSATDSKTYDGKALTNDTVDVTGDGFIEGEGFTATVTGSQLNAGSSDNTFTYTLNDGTKAGNYDVTVVNGTLTVDPKPITVKANDKEKTYGDDDPALDYTVTGLVDESDKDGLDVEVTRTEGENKGDYTITATGDEEQGNYVITYETGTLTVKPNPVAITVEAASKNKTYDGTALTDGTCTFDAAKLVSGDTLTAVVEGTVTDVGTAANKVTSYVVKNAKDEDVTANYTGITTKDGLLEVTKRTVTLTSDTASKTYDAQPLKAETVTVTGDGFVDGEGATYSSFASITDVGSTSNTFEYTLNGNTKAGNYEITKVPGTLTVAAKGSVVVTVTENSATFTYNGTERKAEGYTVSISDPLYKEEYFTFSGSALVTGTKVGTYDMELKPADFANTNKNFEDVTFKIVDGTLTINPIATTLEVTAGSDSKMYDGTPLTKQDYTFTENVLAEGDKLVVVIEGEITDVKRNPDGTVGSIPNNVTEIKVINAAGEDVTDCYTNLVPVAGELTINPRVITVKSQDEEKTYNGNDEFTHRDPIVTGDGLAEGENFIPTYTGTQTDKGESDNTFTLDPAPGTNPDNYDITIVPGKLTVKPVTTPIVITANSKDKTYDGTALTDDGYTFTQNVLVSGDVLTAVVEGTITNAGEIANKVTSYKVTRNGKDITENYADITTADGKLTVNPLGITVTAEAKTKTYGDADPELTAKITGMLAGESESLITYSLSRAKGENVGTYTITPEGKELQGNYKVTYLTNDLTITKRSITVRPDDYTVPYSGGIESPDPDAFSVTEGETAFQDKVTGEVTGGARTIGTHEGELKIENLRIIDKDGNDVTDNYDITALAGDITIESKDAQFGVLIVAEGGTYKYDGLEKKGTLTIQASADPSIAMGLFDNGKVTYDAATGTARITLKGNTFTMTGVNILNSAIHVGTYPVMDTRNIKITDADGSDVTSQFAVKTVQADIVINPREVTLMSGSTARPYDGQYLRNDTITVGQDGFVDGEGAAYDGFRSILGAPKETNSVKNTFTYTLNPNTQAGDYVITTIFGDLIVTPQPYTLLIHYVYADGTTAAPDYYGQLAAGTPFRVVSPAIKNYKPNAEFVQDVMPDQDVEVTVTYLPGEVPGKTYTLEEIVNEPVPKAILGDGDHADCFLPFLFMLIAFGSQLVYMDEDKKYRKLIKELQINIDDPNRKSGKEDND